MHPTPSAPSSARRLAAAAMALPAAAVLLAGCGGAAAGGSTSSTPDLVVAQLAEHSSVPVPGPPLDVSSLRGKTVYWIPITSQAPVFGIEQAATAEAFAAAGVTLQVCDGQANPAQVTRCVDQAVAAGAAGIITSSVPPDFARNAFAAAVAAKIPIEFVNAQPSEIPAGWGAYATALPPEFGTMAEISSDLIIADSKGKGNVLLVGVTDSSVTKTTYEKSMKGYLAKECPGCTVDSVLVGSTTVSNLASQVGAALVKNPNTRYVHVEFDSFAPPVVQALRQANKAGNVKLVTNAGQLDGMQRVAAGGGWADTGWSIAACGWNEADVMLRMMLGQDPLADAHQTPIKTHTAATVKGLDLTRAGWLSGAWTSDDDFRMMFTKLWGVA